MGKLTDEQEMAAFHKRGPACVLAGAGTGKTTTLSHRLSYLVNDLHVDPKRILVTTFTRKATAELYANAYRQLGDPAQQLRISTIDALVWDLAQKAMQQGLMPTVQLLGDAHQRLLLLHYAWDTFGQASGYDRESWAKRVDRANLVRLLELCLRAEMTEGSGKATITRRVKLALRQSRNGTYSFFEMPTPKELKETIQRYLEKLGELGLTDYDLLSVNFLRCLQTHKTFADDLSSEFDGIVVDEFQDTSQIQADILLLLSGKHRNVWVVGDACQQIYEWRGADPKNFSCFLKKTSARKYHLTDNRRSTQPILNCAYYFLSRRVPALKKSRMLKPLKSWRDDENSLFKQTINRSVFLGKLDRALYFVRQILDSPSNPWSIVSPRLKPSDIAILSSELKERTVKEIEGKARANGLQVQFHSSRADRVMKQNLGDAPNWEPGTALKNLYNHRNIRRLISASLRRGDFSDFRTIRSLATAADALDGTLPPQAFTFREAWPALKKTQDREVSATAAVVDRADAIQVMTIHAAKGLEFPVVILMKLGKGGPRSFPNRNEPEDSRLAYVGATRARDVLILVRTAGNFHELRETLAAFGRIGKELLPIPRSRVQTSDLKIEAPQVLPAPPIIAATDLDLYEQCPLKFAAYHEGRFLPEWSVPQSMGARMHKALEYYLQAGMPNDEQIVDQCFKRGLKDGDLPRRRWPSKTTQHRMKKTYREITTHLSKTSTKVLAVEQRYRYLHENSGQIEGVVDALIEGRDGIVRLKEWKTSSDVTRNLRAYELQARAGALGMAAQNSYPVQMVEIVPTFALKNTVSLTYNNTFVDESNKMLEQVFKNVRDRKYEPQSGDHCRQCQLKLQCPMSPKSR